MSQIGDFMALFAPGGSSLMLLGFALKDEFRA
jgi:hypothetical protein